MEIRLGEPVHWRERLTVAEEIVGSFRAGRLVECTSRIRDILRRLATDEKWQVRKVIANNLALIEDEIFDEISARLCNDLNGFVKQAAKRGYARRRKEHCDLAKQESDQKRFARQLARLRDKYGNDAVEEMLALSDARYNLLAGSVAHDVRSVLTHLQPAAAALVRGVNGQADLAILKRKAQRVVEGLAFTERCVKDLELYTQPLAVERYLENLAEVLAVACEMARRNIEELGYDSHMVTLRMEVSDGLRLRMSRHLIILAVANVVKNAYESFMDRPNHLRRGEIVVRAQRREETVEIEIQDNGMGISQENLGELRALIPRRRNKAKRKSTGFGVPIAYRYIEAHGGTLDYDSVEDAGTTVRITLPRTIQGDNYE
jgi:signal transduction histidine kinase